MFFVIEVCWSLKILVVRLVCKRFWGAIKRVCGFRKYECMRIPVSLVFIETSSGRVEHFKSEQGTQRGIFALHIAGNACATFDFQTGAQCKRGTIEYVRATSHAVTCVHT